MFRWADQQLCTIHIDQYRVIPLVCIDDKGMSLLYFGLTAIWNCTAHQILVPWRYVHPQTDHVTFRPARYVHWTFRPLWQFTTVTLRHPFILILWHFVTLFFYYCDTLTPCYCVQVTNVHPPKSWTFCYCIRTSTYFYLECDMASTFAHKWNVVTVCNWRRAPPPPYKCR
jgi:hypothetical protein